MFLYSFLYFFKLDWQYICFIMICMYMYENVVFCMCLYVFDNIARNWTIMLLSCICYMLLHCYIQQHHISHWSFRFFLLKLYSIHSTWLINVWNFYKNETAFHTWRYIYIGLSCYVWCHLFQDGLVPHARKQSIHKGEAQPQQQPVSAAQIDR